MNINNILRWILFLPISILSVYILKLVEYYTNYLADNHDNFIMKWVIAILYCFFQPIIIVLVAVYIVPNKKNLIAKLMSILLILFFSFMLYNVYLQDGDFIFYISFKTLHFCQVQFSCSSKQQHNIS